MHFINKISGLFVMTFLLLVPMDLKAEMKQLVCNAVTPVPTEEDFKSSRKYWAENIRDNCAGQEFSNTYTITLDTSFIETKQSFKVELAHTSCQIPRPLDNGIKDILVSSDELKIHHHHRTNLHINRNTLMWYTGNGDWIDNNKAVPCEIKDLNTSQRKI
jgi:hypothetical protein|tara:strand:+ start:176 stop:655 length:480 start_codon:yes stop_codon:yes gene_type:complete